MVYLSIELTAVDQTLWIPSVMSVFTGCICRIGFVM